MSIELFYGIMFFIFGLCFGSFYNVVGTRLPKNKSIVYPPSHCTNCNHKLKFYELIPVISYVILGGKCSKCKERIGLIDPFFELLTGILFCLCYLKFGLSLDLVKALIFVSILIIISISDVNYYIIPDEVLIFGVILLIVYYVIDTIINKLTLFNGVFLPIINGLASFSLLYLFKVLGDLLFKKESLGGGDIKLLFLIGLVIGFDMSIVSIFIAAFVALPLSVVSLIKDDNNVLPFGPYLSIGALIILFTNINLEIILDFFQNL